MFGHPSQQSHMMMGRKKAAASKRTPSHLRAHQQRLAGGARGPSMGRGSKNAYPATNEPLNTAVAGMDPGEATDEMSMAAAPTASRPKGRMLPGAATFKRPKGKGRKGAKPHANPKRAKTPPSSFYGEAAESY